MVELNSISNAAKGLSRNPLGIIALFIVLIYAFAALTLGATSSLQSNERLPLVWFMVIFPIVVLATFAWLVSSHHEKLYGPGDYQSDDAFLKGLAARKKHTLEIQAQQAQLKERVKEAVVSLTDRQEGDKPNYSTLLDKISGEIDRATNITVDARVFLQDERAEFTLPIAAFGTLGDLTDEVYFRIGNKVRPYEYGYTWVLRNESTREVIKNSRMITISRPGNPLPDRRTLPEVGILPGTILTVEIPS
jgi:hypothetical protein